MNYPNIPDCQGLIAELIEYGRLMHEYGVQNTDIDAVTDEAYNNLKDSVQKLKSLPICKDLLKQEPNDLDSILSLRPEGPRKLWNSFNEEIYLEKLEGALLSRMAGCILGVAVEAWSIEDMENWAKYNGDAFPPTNYWRGTKYPGYIRYTKDDYKNYTLGGLKYVPVDDDITYTLLGLIVAEEYGIDFSTEDVGKAWVKYLPMACSAEDIALRSLKKGLDAKKVADIDNPYCQWIGADIRSDPWAYIAPAFPESAAYMAYNDAYLSHRRNGIYGEMFFSAVQSAAFAVDDPIEAIKIGLSEIPRECSLSKAVKWALDERNNIKNYKDARQAVDDKFKGMSGVHTINNACLTIFGISIGGDDVTKVLSETVAMGLDNDCTAATAGSIIGAIVGKKGIPSHWCKNFNNTINSYLNGIDEFKIDDVVNRFNTLAKRTYSVK